MNYPQKPTVHTEQKMKALRPIDWQHPYRDWRFLTAIAVILVIVVTYLLTGDISWRPRGNWHPEVNRVNQNAAVLPPVTKP